MNRLACLLLVLGLVPAPAVAQHPPEGQSPGEGGIGLDLTADTQPPAPAPPPESPPPPPAGADVASDAPLAAPRASSAQFSEEDRIKSVQRKVYLKKGRFEATPFVTVTVNDPYYTKWGGALRVAYYLADTLALAARGAAIQVVPTDDVRTAKRTFQSRIFNSDPQWALMGDVEWSPLYGKVAFLNSILHFDGYLLGGVGVVNTVTSAMKDAPGGSTRGPNIAADLGLGLRFVARDYLAVNVAVINTSYVDQPLNSSKGITQNMLTLNAGLSFFFPFRSTGREAE